MAPCQAFELFAQGLAQAGHTNTMMLGKGKPINESTDALTQSVTEADFVIIGMSTPAKNAEFERAVANAARVVDTPFGLYADLPGCEARITEWPRNIRDSVALYLAFNEQDAAAVRAGGLLPNTRVYATGNPVRELWTAPPRYSREGVRQKLSVSGDTSMILVPGTKDRTSNIGRFRRITEAAAPLAARGKDILVIASLHPGDPTPPEDYDAALSDSTVPFRVLVGNENIRNSDIIVGADLVVAGLAGSSAMEAAARRVPALLLGDAKDVRSLVEQRGTDVPEAVEAGVAEFFRTDTPDGFSNERFAEVLYPTETDRQRLINAQEIACPVPERIGLAVEQTVQAITEELSRRSTVDA